MTKTRVAVAVVAGGLVSWAAGIGGQAPSKIPGNQWPPAVKGTEKAIPRTADEQMKTFSVPPGFHVELVASDPMIETPILIDFDPDGRMYVLEQLSYLPDTSGRDAGGPVNRVSVLEDTDNDGRMDKKTIFTDKLLMPRALKVLDRGVLIGEPPNLWLFKDTDGDLKADTKENVVNTYGRAEAGIEHNANSLYWAIDNIMYSSEHTWDLRWKNGKFEPLPTLSRGQWQISQDDAGRIYRNVNDSPLYVDYTPARYFMRNPNTVRTRGLYELLIEQMDATVYPVRNTRGVNRGYRDPFFREDGSSIVIQGAGTPTIYRGDRYPKDLYGNAFITDSPTNLVHRMIINDDGSGRLSAKNGYDRGEFIASSDERFRPVSLFDGPDGTMYIVDMYHGVVQAGGLWSAYLREYIESREMLLTVPKGRIWRVVYGTGANRRGPKPALSKATPAQLVQTLSHPIGWWRDTAQRLIVERGDKTVVPALKTLAATSTDWKARLHALWTLDGLEAIEPAQVEKALTDASADVRAAGIRISERWLGQPGNAIAAAVVKLTSDKSWRVRRQLGASLGELPEAARAEPAAAILAQDGADPIVVDAVLSSLKGLEADVLGRVQKAQAAAKPPTEAVSMLAAAVAKSGDVAGTQRIIDIAVNASSPMWQRVALLQGLDAGLPTLAAARAAAAAAAAGGPGAGAGRGGGRGGGGGGGGGGGVSLPGLSAPGGRVAVTPGRGIMLPSEPTALNALAAGTGDLARAAKAAADKLDWSGRPAPVVVVAPLTAEQQKRFAAGGEIYKNLCLGCHMEDGKGKEKLGANLIDSAYVNSADPTAVIRVLLGGKEGPIGLMPPLGPTMSDEQIASALTYIRREWGKTAPAVDPLSVMEIRGLTKSRNKPWTDPELQGGGGGRGRGAGGGQN